jgi:DNA (cytosine-5)-methyltransferase 1
MLSAADVGANHKRERWFLLAHANEQRLQGCEETRNLSEDWQKPGESITPRCGGDGEISDTDSSRLFGQAYATEKEESIGRTEASPLERDWWATEPNVGRMVNGLPLRVDRIKRLGNAVVPLQAKTAFEILLGIRQK